MTFPTTFFSIPHNVPTLTQSFLSTSQIQQTFQISSFKQKYIFEPFEYQQSLQQTLTHQIPSLNQKQQHPEHSQKHSLSINEHQLHEHQFNRNSKVHFGNSNVESFNSTSKSIKTNKTIWAPDNSSNTIGHHKTTFANEAKRANNLSQVNDILNKSLTGQKQPEMKKTFSLMTNNQNVKSQFFNVSQENNEHMYKSVDRDSKQIVFNGRSMKKKTLFNKEKYEEDQKNKLFRKESSKKTSQKLSTSSQCQYNISSPTTQPSGGSMCQSIALGSMLVQNFLKSTYQNGFFQPTSSMTSSKNPSSMIPEPLSFYSFCMLLFPQTSKSLPCSVFVMDTLFYASTPESKDVIYVFKDKKRNLLMKMKNKNKSAYELFMKRRNTYEVAKMKEDKLRKAGYFQIKKKNQSKIQPDQSNSSHQMQVELNHATLTPQRKLIEASVKCLQDEDQSLFRENLIYGSVSRTDEVESQRQNDRQNEDQADVSLLSSQKSSQYEEIQTNHNFETSNERIKIVSSPSHTEAVGSQKQHTSPDVSHFSSQRSIQSFQNKITRLTFKNTFNTFLTQNAFNQLYPNQSPVITPSNSIRESHHSLNTNYVALLKYHNNHIMRLKLNEFKSIFQNPLYANQLFKNNNNTQYIQSLPIEDEFSDLKVYSMHFHFEIFKDEELFLYVKNTLYKQNEYMTAVGKSQFEDLIDIKSLNFNSYDNISIDKKNSLKLKKKLKQEFIQVYLYYLIFEMYTYISMHYNKQLLNGIFRFIEYDNDFALFQTQNIVIKPLPPHAEFIKTKIFPEDCFLTSKQSRLSVLKQKNTGEAIKQQNTHEIRPQQKFKPLSPSQYQTPSSVESATSTPSQTLKQINKQILKLLTVKQQQSGLQKQVLGYFTRQNDKIQNEMNTYFNDKIEKIKNVKDMHLSKNIFKVINEDVLANKQIGIDKNQHIQEMPKQNIDELDDFHSILNDEKKLQNFLKFKEQNDPYARKTISNYSVVRWKKEIKKLQQRKSASGPNSNGKQNDISLFEMSQNHPFQLKNSHEPHKNRPLSSNPSSSVVRSSNKKPIMFRQTSNTWKKQSANIFTLQSSRSQTKKHLSNQRTQQGPSSKQFEKKLIYQKYNQFNKSKFKLKAFKADKFI